MLRGIALAAACGLRGTAAAAESGRLWRKSHEVPSCAIGLAEPCLGALSIVMPCRAELRCCAISAELRALAAMCHAALCRAEPRGAKLRGLAVPCFASHSRTAPSRTALSR